MSIGFNVHPGVKDEQRLLDFVNRTRPRWMLFMNNMSLAERAKAISPGTNIIYRDWQPDGAWTNHQNPQDFLDYTQRLLGDRPFYAYVDNEVGLKPEWYSSLIDKNEKTTKLEIVVANISVGTPEFQEWKHPAVSNLIKKIADNRDRIVLGMHEYGHVLVTSGLQDQNYSFAVADWPREILRSKNNFHIGRFKALIDAHPNLPYRIVITEHGWDTLGDMKSRQTLYGAFETSYGWTNCVPYWQKIYGSGLDVAQFMALQVGYADKIIYPYGDGRVECQLLYCYGAVDRKWMPFDFEPNRSFIGYLEDLNSVPVPKPTPPTPVPVPIPEPPIPDDATEPMPPITKLDEFKADLKNYIDKWK